MPPGATNRSALRFLPLPAAVLLPARASPAQAPGIATVADLWEPSNRPAPLTDLGLAGVPGFVHQRRRS